jgi:hypothetical protein
VTAAADRLPIATEDYGSLLQRCIVLACTSKDVSTSAQSCFIQVLMSTNVVDSRLSHGKLQVPIQWFGLPDENTSWIQ